MSRFVVKRVVGAVISNQYSVISIQWMWGGLLVLVLVFGGGGGGNASAQSPAQDIFNLVNQYRTANGLPAFQWSNGLASAAQNQANWMAQTEIYSHYQTNGSSPQSRANGAGFVGFATENIVGGTNLTPREGLIWWQNSGVHNRTLLSSNYSQAGTGYALSVSGQRMYVLVAGRPSDEPPPANRHCAPWILRWQPFRADIGSSQRPVPPHFLCHLYCPGAHPKKT